MKVADSGLLGLQVPQLGFGCSTLLGRAGRAESLRALNTAWEQGIRFFDIARSYGYGESEGLLGEFLAGRRHQAVIATKFGILPSRQPAWKRAARAAARQALSFAPSLLPVLRRGAKTQLTAGHFTIEVLRQSIEESLRKLRSDYVDLLFLHDAPASVLEQQDLLDAMARLVEAGKVRVAGLSAQPDVVALALGRRIAPLQAMEFACNPMTIKSALRATAASDGNTILVANQPFGGVARLAECRDRLRKLAADESVAPGLRERIAPDDDAVLADITLNVILRGTGIHVVLPTMIKPAHIANNVAALAHSRFSDEEVAVLRNALANQN